MKKLYLFAAAILFFSSCKKEKGSSLDPYPEQGAQLNFDYENLFSPPSTGLMHDTTVNATTTWFSTGVNTNGFGSLVFEGDKFRYAASYKMPGSDVIVHESTLTGPAPSNNLNPYGVHTISGRVVLGFIMYTDWKFWSQRPTDFVTVKITKVYTSHWATDLTQTFCDGTLTAKLTGGSASDQFAEGQKVTITGSFKGMLVVK